MGRKTKELELELEKCTDPYFTGKQAQPYHGASNLALNPQACECHGLWKRSCSRWRAREPRELPPFVFLALLARADVPDAGGTSVECLVSFFRVRPQTRRISVQPV